MVRQRVFLALTYAVHHSTSSLSLAFAYLVGSYGVSECNDEIYYYRDAQCCAIYLVFSTYRNHPGYKIPLIGLHIMITNAST